MADYLGNMKGVCLITGAASGIGRECARAFAKLGAKLVLVDRNYEGLEVLAKELALDPSSVLLGGIDVTNLKALAEFIRSIEQKMGGLNFCINCSGILGPDYDEPMDKLSDDTWKLVLDINLLAPSIITREAVRIMLRTPPLPSLLESSSQATPRREGTCTRIGAIVNLGSSASLRARSASGAPYIASKHGLVGLSKSTAVTYGSKGIRCNTIAPGFVRTPLIAGIQSKADSIATQIVPMGRVAEPQEVADLVVWLCSERSNYVNGALVSLDGGWSAT